MASKPKRDLLMMDFWEMETISFPPDGSSMTPAHHYSEFRFKIYAPIAFRYFRDLFGIQPDDFMVIIVNRIEKKGGILLCNKSRIKVFSSLCV